MPGVAKYQPLLMLRDFKIVIVIVDLEEPLSISVILCTATHLASVQVCVCVPLGVLHVAKVSITLDTNTFSIIHAYLLMCRASWCFLMNHRCFLVFQWERERWVSRRGTVQPHAL